MTVDLAPWLIAAGLVAAGLVLGIVTLRGFRRGKIRLLVRNFDGPWSRRTEPKRFWLSLGYNLVLAGVLLFAGVASVVSAIDVEQERPLRNACVQATAPERMNASCNRWIAEGRPDPFELGFARSQLANAAEARGNTRQATLLRRAAIAAYGSSLDGYPDDADALWNSALLMEQLGDIEAAREALRGVTQLEPDRGRGWLELGIVELQLAHFPDAIIHLTRAVELLPGEARPLAARAMAYGLSGDRVRAAADLAQARARDSAEPWVGYASGMNAPAPEAGSGQPPFVVDHR